MLSLITYLLNVTLPVCKASYRYITLELLSEIMTPGAGVRLVVYAAHLCKYSITIIIAPYIIYGTHPFPHCKVTINAMQHHGN